MPTPLSRFCLPALPLLAGLALSSASLAQDSTRDGAIEKVSADTLVAPTRVVTLGTGHAQHSARPGGYRHGGHRQS